MKSSTLIHRPIKHVKVTCQAYANIMLCLVVVVVTDVFGTRRIVILLIPDCLGAAHMLLPA